MKNYLKFSILFFVFLAVIVTLYLVILDNPLQKEQKARLPLFIAADSANMMIASAEGLGDAIYEKTVDGQLYRNFVQLLRMTHTQENLVDTFTTNCKTGVRLALYKDTTLVDEFLLADNIGRKGVAGIWSPKRPAKINKFLKDIGVQYKPCIDSFEVEKSIVNKEQNRTILTMPKFGANRKNKNKEPLDSIENFTPTISPELTNGKFTNNILNVLDEIILPPDTAWGTPLSIRFTDWERGEVIFYKAPDSCEKQLKSIELTKSQMNEFGDLLNNTQLETFSMSELITFNHFARIILYGKDGINAELWSVSEKHHYLVKYHRGESFGLFEGFWIPRNQNDLKIFFDKLNGISLE